MAIKKNYYFDKHLHHFLLLFLIVISFIYYSFCYNIKTDFDYPIKKRLNNGNYLVMTTQGIYLYDEEFKIKMEVFIFDGRLVDHNEYLFSENIAQFWTEDEGYIICLLVKELFIFSKNCIFVAHLSLDYIQNRFGYKIVPYKHIENNYYFAIISIEKPNIIIRNYKYFEYKITLEGTFSYFLDFEPYDISLTCELMKYSNNKVITCFIGEYNNVHFKSFNINLEEIPERSGKVGIEGIYGAQLFTSDINSNKPEELLCCTQKDSDMKCFGYNINTNKFTDLNNITDSGCKFETIQMKVEYFPETEEFLAGCKGNDNVYSYYIAKFSSNFTFENYNKIENIVPEECNDVNLFNIIYSSKYQKYSIIIDSTECQDKRLVNISLISSFKNNDYPSDEPSILICNGYHPEENFTCYDNIPDGYSIKDNTQKIIKKCPSEEIINDTNNNNKIKCILEKCLDCSPESISNKELCIKCNTEEGYFSKEVDITNINPFINCYKEPDGYYLENNIYKSCYSTCKKCYGIGDENNNNCSECIDNYTLKNDFDKNNCYINCNYNYYFDEDKVYHCTDNNTCPKNYKLINSTNKCIDNCNNL